MTDAITAAQLRAGLTAGAGTTEDDIHKAILDYLRLVLGGALIHHSPNEVRIKIPAGAPWKDQIKRAIAIYQTRMRSMGMRKGFPDILVIWRGHTILFEVKRSGEHPTEDQKVVMRQAEQNGAKVAVVRSVDDAREALKVWGLI